MVVVTFALIFYESFFMKRLNVARCCTHDREGSESFSHLLCRLYLIQWIPSVGVTA